MDNLEIDKKINQGFLWLFASSIATSIVLFFLNIFIVRILSPSIFGVMSICMTIITFLTIVSSFGIGDALINRKENFECAKKAAFSTFVIATTIFSIIIIGLSPQIADFYKEKILSIALTLTMVGFWIRNIAAIPAALLAKKLEFKKIALFELTASISNPIIVILTFLLAPEISYISLPLGYAVSSLVYSAAIIIKSEKIKWHIDIKETKKLASFGAKVMTTDILAVALLYGMNLLIGKIYDLELLGIFTIAFTITNMPVELIASSFSRASYPGFSSIKENKKEITRIFKKVSEKTILLAFPIIAWFFVFANDFNSIILKKNPVLAQTIMLFCIFAFLRTLQKNYTSMFAGAGKPGLNVKVSATEAIILIISTIILIPTNGFFGIIAALIIARFFSMVTALFLSRKILEEFLKTNLKIAKTIATTAIVPIIFFGISNTTKTTTVLFTILTVAYFAAILVQYFLSGNLKKILS